MTQDECPNCSSIVNLDAYISETSSLNTDEWRYEMKEWLGRSAYDQVFLPWMDAQLTWWRLRVPPEDKVGVVGPWGMQGVTMFVQRMRAGLNKFRDAVDDVKE